jgi:zinc and cadmium transporter
MTAAGTIVAARETNRVRAALIVMTLFANSLAGLVGGLLSERWLARHQWTLVGFAAGAILAAVFVDLLPEAIETLGGQALLVTFGAFVAAAILEWLVGGHHRGHHGEKPSRTLPASLLVSDALHNFGDGAAIAAAFLVSLPAGAGVAAAVIAHELPQEVGDYVLLRAAGWGRGRALLALAAVQLTAGAGAVAVVLAATFVTGATTVVLAAAAGTFPGRSFTSARRICCPSSGPVARRRTAAGACSASWRGSR